MCSDYRLLERVPVDDYFPTARLLYPEGIPNFEPREDIRITDRAPILRAAAEGTSAVELVQRRWSWPGPGGKPVYNFRSDGRDLPRGRCIILADGFYEFTAHTDPKSKRKHKWLFTLKNNHLFTLKGERWFGIAGLWRGDAAEGEGEAFTMLTCEPSRDVAPYHDRSIVILPPADWPRWLDPAVPSRNFTRPLPAGSLEVEQIN